MAIAWHNANYQKRRVILLDSPTANVADFPVLLKLTDTEAIANADMASLRYLIADWLGNVLAYEEESYTEGASYVNFETWASVPNIYASPSSDQNKVVVYYDYNGGSDLDDAANVWDANFEGVWHLHQGDSTAANFYADSSGNAHHGTLVDTDGDTIQADGKVYKCLDFNGDADYIGVGSITPHATLNTIEAWIRSDSVTTTQRVFAQGISGGNNLSMQIYSSAIRGLHGAGGGGQLVGGSESISSDTWYHVAYSVDDGANTAILYVNGVPEQTGTSNTLATSAQVMCLAAQSPAGAAERFNGDIDEARLSVGAARTADWLNYEYNNIADADNAQTWGAEEEVPSEPSVAAFQPQPVYRRPPRPVAVAY